MKGKLLDTNIALFALGAPSRLTAAAMRAIESGPNLLSVVSYWEVALKCAKGSLELDDPHQWWQDALAHLAATPLLLRPEHITALNRLPMHHKDPFDRVLLAQAMVEELVLVTSDRELHRYASARLRIVR